MRICFLKRKENRSEFRKRKYCTRLCVTFGCLKYQSFIQRPTGFVESSLNSSQIQKNAHGFFVQILVEPSLNIHSSDIYFFHFTVRVWSFHLPFAMYVIYICIVYILSVYVFFSFFSWVFIISVYWVRSQHTHKHRLKWQSNRRDLLTSIWRHSNRF